MMLVHILTDTSILPFQTTKLKLALKGMARLNPHCPKQASPITPQILLTIHQILDLNNTSHIVFWSLFLLAFFTFARKSNLVAESKLKPSKLYRQTYVIGSKGLLVTFDWTKTIQFGQRCLIIPVVSNPKSVLCPTQAYVHMCQVVSDFSYSAAFLLPKLDSSPQPVTYAEFQGFLKSWFSAIGLNQNEFSSRSFRRGGVTWALRSNIPGELIKVHGDWASDAHLKYLDFL